MAREFREARGAANSRPDAPPAEEVISRGRGIAGELTPAGHDPQAYTLLAQALKPHVSDPWDVALNVFATLHDAGLRLVPSDERALKAALWGERLDGKTERPDG